MRAAILFLLAFSTISGLSQTTESGTATAKGTCNIANIGRNNTLQIKCGVGEKQGKQIIDLLNKVLDNQIDPAAVMQKLDEILAQRQQPVQMVNAPNGIGNIGGTLINPQVNNFGYMRKVLSADQLALVTALAKSLPPDENSDQNVVLFCEMGNANSCSVAAQLSSAFAAAGWNMGKMGYMQGIMSNPPDPILIVVHSNPDLRPGQPIISDQGLPPGAWEMARLLKGFGLSVAFSTDDTESPNKFRIVVGNYP